MSDTWKTLAKDLLFQSPFFELYKEKVETFGGKTMDAYYRMELGDWVQVVAEDEAGKLVMIKQYRHGSKDTHIEIVGGAIDKGEDPLEAAKRELLEEVGYESDEWEQLAITRPNPAIQDNRMFSYVAKNAKEVAEQDLDPYEEIDVVLYSKEEVKEMISKNEIDHSLILMSLMLYFSQE